MSPDNSLSLLYVGYDLPKHSINIIPKVNFIMGIFAQNREKVK